MFFQVKTPFQVLITTGVMISCCLFFGFSIAILFRWGLAAVIISLLFSALPVSIILGFKAGYMITRILYILCVFAFFTAPFNPFALMDVDAAGESQISFAAMMEMGAGLCLFFVYVLGVHWNLRQPTPELSAV